MIPFRTRLAGGIAGLALAIGCANAGNFVDVKRMGMEIADDIARAAVLDCRERGYQVSAVVVDRSGHPQAVLRDTHASRFTMQIAREKANGVVLSRIDSGAFRENRGDIRMEMNHVDDVMMLEGGLAIEAGGAFVGAVGVSGAPGGDKDAECAAAALETVADRLAFAD